MSAPKPTADEQHVHPYPGGEELPGYRWAFTVWIVLFLGVLCLGLLNYLGIYAKKFWPGL